MPAFEKVCAALLLFFNAGISYADSISVTDDAGITLQMPAPAQRIITLAPSLTELVYATGAGEHLVGVASLSDYPKEAQALPQIGDASHIDFERIIALHPDLVIAWKSGNHAGDIEQLRHMRIPVYVAEPEHLADIPRTMQAIATLTDTTSIANAGIVNFNRMLTQLQQQYATKKPIRVFYEIWHTPLMTVNGQHMISDVLKLCGGANVFADVPVLTPVVSTESVIAARPEVIVGGGSARMTSEDFAAEWKNEMPALATLPTIYVNPDLIQRQTPRVLDGTKEICQRLDEIRTKEKNE